MAGRRALAEARPAEGGVQSVHRALDVLEALAAAGRHRQPGRPRGGVRPARADPAPAGGHAGRPRLPAAAPDRRYSLGSRLVPLGADAHALLGERALPVLRALAELTGESANLAVLTQGRAEYVAQAPGRHTMRTFTEVGNRVELHCTGVGKALLAAVDPAAGRPADRRRPADRPDPRAPSPTPPPCRPRSRSSAPAATPSTRARWRSASAASPSACPARPRWPSRCRARPRA